jgi:hypothetical protein
MKRDDRVRDLKPPASFAPQAKMAPAEARSAWPSRRALAGGHAEGAGNRRRDAERIPDQAAPDDWDTQASGAFRDFFVGAMTTISATPAPAPWARATSRSPPRP